MVYFSDAQLEEIKNSDDFIAFLASKGENADKTAVLNEYLQNNDVLANWKIKFAKEDMDKADTYLRGEQEDISYTYEVKSRQQADRTLKIKRQGKSDEFELETQGYHPKTGGKRGKATSAKVVMSGDNKQELEISGVLGESIPYVMSVNSNIISVKIEGYDEILFETEGKGHTKVQANVLKELQRKLGGAKNDTAISWSADLSKVYSDSVYARDFLVENKNGNDGMKQHLSRISYVYDEKIIHDDEENEDKFVPDIDQVLIQHGAEHPDTTFFMDEVRKLYASAEIGSKEKKFYRTIINTYEMNFPNYLRESDSNGNPRRLNLELIKTEEDVKFAEKFIKALGYEVVADYREHPEKVGFPVRKQKVVRSVEIEEPTLPGRYVPNIDAALTEHGFGDESFIQELKNRKENLSGKERAFYEAVINAYESNEYQKSLRKNLNEEFIKSEEDVRIAEKIMQDLGFNIDPGKTDYQGENSAKVDFPVREQKIEDDEEDIRDDVLIYETIQGRKRSDDSDKNEFLLDKLRLQVLLDMGKINQDIFDEAIKNPSNAIKKLNEKLPLSEKEQVEFEAKITDYMLNDEKLFYILPPSILAQKYEEIKNQAQVIINQDANADIGQEEARIAQIAKRMDELITDFYRNEGIHFADITNISDTYDGYIKMFEAREKDLDKEKDSQIIEMIKDDRKKMNELIGEYDREWNIENIADANNLEQRFDGLRGDLENISVDENILKSISNIRFLDEDGNPEPQFTNEQGYEVAKGSKLETMIRIAKQMVLMENLNTDIKKEDLSKAVGEKLYEVLYGAQVGRLIEKGVLEDPNQFTDKRYLSQFISDLENPEKPIAITHTAYNSTVDACINSVAGFAHRLGSKIGKDKPVVVKLFDPLKDIDNRSGDRTEKTVDKKAYRLGMLKRVAVGGASAFLISGAITTFGTIAAADATLTTLTGGFNKFAGMAVGCGLATMMTWKQIRTWKKARRERGEDTKWWKDRSMLMSVGTTALGAAALGFAATGNPGVAKALGLGALALGTTNTVWNTLEEGKEVGVSRLESIGWAALQATINIGAAVGGRATASATIDAINQHHPENRIFQHEETTIKRGVVNWEEKTMSIYKDGAIENAQEILKSWYSNDPDLLQQRVAAIEAYNAENGTNINPHRYLLAAHDAGALSADNNLLHVQGGEDAHTFGNHKVLGEGWSDVKGIPQDAIKALANSVSGTGVNITSESLATFNELDTKHISAQNQVGYGTGAQSHNDGVLGFNATTADNGHFVSSEKGDIFATNADAGGARVDVTYKEPVYGNVEDKNLVPNEKFLGLGMVGTGRRLPKIITTVKERVGSLLDRIITKTKVIKKDPEDVLVGDNKKADKNQPFEAKHKESLPEAQQRLNGSKTQHRSDPVNTNKRRSIPIPTKQEKVR